MAEEVQDDLEGVANAEVVTIIRYVSGELVVDHDTTSDVALSLLVQAQHTLLSDIWSEDPEAE